VSFYTKGPDC
jgi:hypothetical protein